MEDLKAELLEYIMIEEFLIDLKKEFEEGANKMLKIAELKKIEQGSRITEKFVQKLRRVAKDSRYERRLLVEEFKREMNEVIKRKLMKVERLLRSIKQWYERAIDLNRYW